MELKVHLTFPGTCEEALNFYKEALGGETSLLLRKTEEFQQPLAEEDKNKILHMVIKTTDFELAGEDIDSNQKVVVGNNTKLTLSFNEIKKCQTIFDLFAKGGTITVPFEKTFYCDGLGELTDKFGISWIIMVSEKDCEE